MFERELRRIREVVRRGQYVITDHADEERDEDELLTVDVEQVINTGEIQEQQIDAVTAERKYRIRGESTSGESVEVVVKLSPTGKAVIVTVYRV